MDITTRSVFCNAAQVSKLLTAEQLEEVLRAATKITAGPPLSLSELDDEKISVAAIQLKFVNRWQAEQLKAGRTKFSLGPYQIIDSIGAGGMGHVFKAEHAMLGRVEAIKVLPKTKTSPESIAAFQREIRAQALLDHPNLVRVTYADQDGATYFFVTELVPGMDLRRLVRRYGRLTMQESATIISQAALALDHAHNRNLIHRDIKPGNLLVTPEGIVKVTDLGLAGFLHEDLKEGRDPRAGKIVGTADYLAPEIIRNPNDVTAASDIYSLGCTLYYAITGKVPFPGGTTADKLRRHCDETPMNPSRINPNVDEAFLEVMADMMEKFPRKRLASAAEVARRLAPWTLDTAPVHPKDEKNEKSDSAKKSFGQLLANRNSQQDPHFVDDAHDAESPSQASQGTEPVGRQETKPIPRIPSPLEIVEVVRQRVRWNSPLAYALLGVGIAITVLILGMILRN